MGDEPTEIPLTRLWIMDWVTREVRMYKEDGGTLLMLPVFREVKGRSPFRSVEEHFAYAALFNLPALPVDWLSISIFGLYPETEEEERPWIAFPKVDLNIDPREWRTVGSKADGSHLFAGVEAPDTALIPMADRWEAR